MLRGISNITSGLLSPITVTRGISAISSSITIFMMMRTTSGGLFASLSIQSCVKATLRLPMKGTVKTASTRYIAMTVIHCAAVSPVTPERAGYRTLHPASVITSIMLP